MIASVVNSEIMALLPNGLLDWWAFLLRTKWTTLGLLLCLGTVLPTLYFRPFRYRSALCCFLVIGALILTANLITAVAGRQMLLTLLGSEDDQIAERAYNSLADKVETNWILSRINYAEKDDNVRFYLCRMLATNQKEDIGRRLEAIKDINPDWITPRFFALNTINADIQLIPAPMTTRGVAEYYVKSKR